MEASLEIQSATSNMERTREAADQIKRRLVVFADGTGAAFSQQESNIWRLYKALDCAGGDYKVFYIPGVGTSRIPVWRELDGATGLGVPDNVRAAYRFLCENWRKGDEIFLFGFSRGAFTVRTLAGMIYHVGLMPDLDPNGLPLSRAEVSANVRGAWREYRRKATDKGNFPTIRLIRAIRDASVTTTRVFRSLKPHRQAMSERDTYFRERVEVPIRFMGLFDTVEAFGVPIEELRGIIDRWIWPISFRNHILSRRVETARHALALDDDRRTFHPVRIDLTGSEANRDIREVWFPGAHSDVGGGYPDDRAACEPLVWIAEEAQRAGLRFDPQDLQRWKNSAAGRGPIHDGRAGLGALYRYAPRDLSGIPPIVHPSVEARIKAGPERYAPIALVGVPLVWGDNARAMGSPQTYASGFAEDLKDSVVGRKISLAAIFLLATALATAPAWMGWLDLGQRPILGFNQVLGSIGDAALSFSPGWSGPWLGQFAETPVPVTMLAALLAWAFVDHRRRRPAIMEDTHRHWMGGPVASEKGLLARWGMQGRDGVARRVMSALVVPPAATPRSAMLRVLRSWKPFIWVSRLYVRWIAPWAIVAAVLAGVVIGLNRVALGIMVGSGGFCSQADSSWTPVRFESGAMILVDSKSRCAPARLTVEKGMTYRVSVTVKEPLTDNGTPATPAGLASGGGWKMTFGAPLRRMWSADWMQLIVQIGERGRAEIPLELEYVPSASGNAPQMTGAEYSGTFVAPRDGPLYFYINDAWVPLPNERQPFYQNNNGHLDVAIVRQQRS